MRIKVYPGLAMGNGTCRQFASAVHQLDDEGYLELHRSQVPPKLERDAALSASACACAARAITLLADAPSSTRPTEGKR